MIRSIDLIADLGEGFGAYEMADDAGILEWVSSANIACGFHAGDPRTMMRVVELAAEKSVGIGAHPGFPDLAGFGRRDMRLSCQEVLTDTLYQIGALNAFVKANGARMQHVSPHGRLANAATGNREYAEAIAEAVRRFDPGLIVVTQAGELEHAARRRGLSVGLLLFADRAYHEDGSLVSRDDPRALIKDEAEVLERCVKMVAEGKVTTLTGREIEVTGDSLLLHGDTADSLRLAAKIVEALRRAGVTVRRLGESV
jgi:UPF0271 protein